VRPICQVIIRDVNVLYAVAAFTDTLTQNCCHQLRLRNTTESRLTDIEPDICRICVINH